jgi:hypothetical protein
MLKKSMIAAGAVAVALVAFQPNPASADVSFQFQFGNAWNGGHSGGGYHGGQNYHNYQNNQRLTCRQARRNLRRSYGFRRIRAIECNGNRYTFRARRNGQVWRIKVDAYTGDVIRMRRI